MKIPLLRTNLYTVVNIKTKHSTIYYQRTSNSVTLHWSTFNPGAYGKGKYPPITKKRHRMAPTDKGQSCVTVVIRKQKKMLLFCHHSRILRKSGMVKKRE